jgi:hypothetical protein
MLKVKEKNAYDGLFLIRNASIIKEMHQGKLFFFQTACKEYTNVSNYINTERG